MKLPFAIAPLALLAGPAFAQHEGHGAPSEAEAHRPDVPETEEAAPAEPGPHALTGALGPYPATREASGTACSPIRARIPAPTSPPADGL